MLIRRSDVPLRSEVKCEPRKVEREVKSDDDRALVESERQEDGIDERLSVHHASGSHLGPLADCGSLGLGNAVVEDDRSRELPEGVDPRDTKPQVLAEVGSRLGVEDEPQVVVRSLLAPLPLRLLSFRARQHP